MTYIQDFIKCLNEIVDETFPNTKRYIIYNSDHIEDMVLELREENKKLCYSPSNLYSESNNYEETIEQFLKKWESILQQEQI